MKLPTLQRSRGGNTSCTRWGPSELRRPLQRPGLARAGRSYGHPYHAQRISTNLIPIREFKAPNRQARGSGLQPTSVPVGHRPHRHQRPEGGLGLVQRGVEEFNSGGEALCAALLVRALGAQHCQVEERCGEGNADILVLTRAAAGERVQKARPVLPRPCLEPPLAGVGHQARTREEVGREARRSRPRHRARQERPAALEVPRGRRVERHDAHKVQDGEQVLRRPRQQLLYDGQGRERPPCEDASVVQGVAEGGQPRADLVCCEGT
mmetsp:Transcript_57585/g.182390  ORF Transcript_57585/g.182390 Transcript_57585/m.182390 type:complete len:266 (-) Transcript_57585:184-981(-)